MSKGQSESKMVVFRIPEMLKEMVSAYRKDTMEDFIITHGRTPTMPDCYRLLIAAGIRAHEESKANENT
jgi:hypothetical protein